MEIKYLQSIASGVFSFVTPEISYQGDQLYAQLYDQVRDISDFSGKAGNMFLSKRKDNGIYYLFIDKKKKLTTGTRTKTEAIKFLRAYNEERHKKQESLKNISLKDFAIVIKFNFNIIAYIYLQVNINCLC